MPYGRNINQKNKMKISEMINKLQVLQERHGDLELSFSVKDHFTTYGTQMVLFFDPVKHFYGYASNGDAITINGFALTEDANGKKSKITFRA